MEEDQGPATWKWGLDWADLMLMSLISIALGGLALGLSFYQTYLCLTGGTANIPLTAIYFLAAIVLVAFGLYGRGHARRKDPKAKISLKGGGKAKWRRLLVALTALIFFLAIVMVIGFSWDQTTVIAFSLIVIYAFWSYVFRGR